MIYGLSESTFRSFSFGFFQFLVRLQNKNDHRQLLSAYTLYVYVISKEN